MPGDFFFYGNEIDCKKCKKNPAAFYCGVLLMMELLFLVL